MMAGLFSIYLSYLYDYHHKRYSVINEFDRLDFSNISLDPG